MAFGDIPPVLHYHLVVHLEHWLRLPPPGPPTSKWHKRAVVMVQAAPKPVPKQVLESGTRSTPELPEL